VFFFSFCLKEWTGPGMGEMRNACIILIGISELTGLLESPRRIWYCNSINFLK
jgi:hypothetical protein